MRPGETFVFEVVDAPPHLRFTMTKKGEPSRTATVHAESAYRSPASRVTFYNREFQGANRVAHLRDVLITILPRVRRGS